MNKALDPTAAWPFPTNPASNERVRHAGRPAAVVARVVLMALGLREGSYDNEASDAAQAEAQAEYNTRKERAEAEGDKSYIMFIGPDYARFYRQGLEACCWVAAKKHDAEELAQIVLLALHWSTDACDWAMETLGEKYVHIPYDADTFANVPPRWRTYAGPVPDEDEAQSVTLTD